MRFDILTLFPELFDSYLGQSILKLAIDRQLVDVQTHNFRDFAEGRHKQVDDKPFGGGPGMCRTRHRAGGDAGSVDHDDAAGADTGSATG